MPTAESQVSGADTVIASDGDVDSILVRFVVDGSCRTDLTLTTTQFGKHVVDFASYLRRVQPPVVVEGRGEYPMKLTAHTANEHYGAS